MERNHWGKKTFFQIHGLISVQNTGLTDFSCFCLVGHKHCSPEHTLKKQKPVAWENEIKETAG